MKNCDRTRMQYAAGSRQYLQSLLRTAYLNTAYFLILLTAYLLPKSIQYAAGGRRYLQTLVRTAYLNTAYFLILLTAYLLLPSSVFAHEGEDHGAEKKATTAAMKYFSSEAISEKYEVLV